MTIRCEKCGKPITHILTNIFDRDGSDYEQKIEISSDHSAVIFHINANWVGYELTEEEQRERILCPHCHKYPFNCEEIHIYDNDIDVVMFMDDKQLEKQDSEVESWIKKFKFVDADNLEAVFTSGNCYYFAVILNEHFGGEIYYLPIANHFVCKINENFYDITGKVIPDEKPICWADYKKYDELEYNRIVRDCLNFDTRGLF